MDFLNPIITQIRDLFRSMTPGARLTAGLLLGVVVISLTYLVSYQVGEADAYLMGGEPFSARQLPAMEAAFAQANLRDYSVEGNRIRVPRGTQSLYMGALADAGALPPNFGSYLEKALANESVFESEKQKAERLKIARQNELALILRSMPGIENASVLYDVKKGVALARGRDEFTATVSIKPIGNEPLEPGRVPMIRHLVAGAIAGLKSENVTIADLNGRHYPGGSGSADGAIADATEDPYYARQRMYEVWLRGKIQQALRYIPGADVQVTADLNRELRNISRKVEHDPKAVVYSSETETATNRQETAGPAGRPGPVAQGPAAGATRLASAPKDTKAEEVTNERQQSVVGTTETETEIKGLTPERVKVTIGLPSNYYLQVWREQNPTAEGEEPTTPDATALADIEEKTRTKIQQAIVPMLPPVAPGDDPFPNVTVTTYQSLTPDEIALPGVAENALAWAGRYWSTLGLLGLAGFSLLTLRSMIKSAPEAEPSAAGVPDIPDLAVVGGDEPEGNESETNEEATRRLARRKLSGPSLKEELSEIVRDDPDSAASILRTWINNAG